MNIFGRDYQVEVNDRQMQRGFFMNKLSKKRENKKSFIKSIFCKKEDKRVTK